MSKYEPHVIDAAIKQATQEGKLHCGFGGNCAKFAVALNRALGGGGDCVYVDGGGHYEYVDHVALLYEGEYYDGRGHISEKDFLESACLDDDDDGDYDYDEDEDEDEAREIETGTVSDEDALRMVDSTGGGMAPYFNEGRFEQDFNQSLTRIVSEIAVTRSCV